MKNVILAEPSTFVFVGMGFLVLLFLMALVGAAIFLIVHFSGKRQNVAPTVAPSTQIIPRKCPQCGAELKPETSEGLCPACLLKRGFATEGSAQPGQTPFVPPPPAELAKTFPQLEILELIGKGGMGAVYKARQPTLERLVALKILPARSGNDPGFTERFTREARALARLSHPNIVAVHDFGTVGQASSLSPSENAVGKSETGKMPVLHYFIMEFVDGPNLRQVEQAGKLTPREALVIIPQICTALQFAHDEGIVHRDIKPENVLLYKKGRVKISDFGLAKILGQEPQDFRLTGARDVMGTPHYMAPEQVEKPQEVDHRADIYSLGVVFYEMLTGELPLGKFQPPSAKVQVDVRLDEVVLRSLAKEPERRYQHVSEVKTDVETIAATGSAGVPPAGSGAAPIPSGGTPDGTRATHVLPEPHFSRTAIVGACWAPLFFLMVLVMLWLARAGVTPGRPAPGPVWWQALLSFTLLPLGVISPFGTTILGWIGVSQIRRSAGRLYGMWLALFDGLLFPLLALDGLVVFACVLAARLVAGSRRLHGSLFLDVPEFTVWLLLTILISALVDYVIIRWVWRAVNRPLEGVRSGALTPSQSSSGAWKIAAILVAGVLLLLAVPVGMWLLSYESIRQPSVRPVPILETELVPQFPVKSDYIGKSYFPKGDSIQITSVERSKEQMTVRGRYNLVSLDKATLALYITSTNVTDFPEDPQQTMQISKGRGDFELSCGHLVRGLPHVSMYADGESFAAIYFGTKAEAMEESEANWSIHPGRGRRALRRRLQGHGGVHQRVRRGARHRHADLGGGDRGGVAENVIVGQQVPMGTGLIEVYMSMPEKGKS